MENVNFVVNSRLLDNIGLAMYSSLPKALSELVANSYDADAQNLWLTIPKKIVKNSEIIIKDDGHGMSKDFIKKSYMQIGSNNRIGREKSPNLKRLLIGSKGIGKFAGLGIANIMRVETINKNKKCVFEINRTKLDIKEKSLESIKIPISEQKVKEAKGTTIYLKELLAHVSTVSEEELRTFFVREFGFPKKFSVYVNGQRYSSDDISGKKIEIKDEIEKYGKISGRITVAEKPKDVPKPAGIITKVRERRILGPTLFDINSHGHQYRVAERIIGEIEVPFLDPEDPKERQDQFIISTSRDGFNLNHPKFIAYKKWTESKLIEISRNLEDEQAEERKRKLLENRSVQSTIRRLPKEIQNKFRKLIEELIPKLNELPQEKAIAIIDLLIKSMESNEMVQILRSLEEADEKDISKLANILETWGIYEISSTTEHIRQRLTIIDKFEKVIGNIKALEYKDIHKLIEPNLWLLNDNYNLYSSNKTLKTVLENKIIKRFIEHKKDRPDIIVKTLLSKVIVIELKRPSHKVVSKDFAQVSEYLTIIKRNQPGADLIECYLIGNEFDDSVRNPDIEKMKIYLKSYSEILQEVKSRYKEILNIIGQG